MKLRELNLKKNKRGDFTGLLYLLVMISAFAFFLLIAGYISVTISAELKAKLNSSTDQVNDAFDATTNTANNTLSAVWFIMFGGLLLGLFITAYFIPTHPIFVPIFIILLVITIIVGVAMSNAYETLYEIDTLSDMADTQGSIYFMMSNLPYVALILGIIVLIVTFAKSKGGTTPMM